MTTFIAITTIALVLFFGSYILGFVSTALGFSWGVGHKLVKDARNPGTGYKAMKDNARKVHDSIVDHGVVKGSYEMAKDQARRARDAGKNFLGKVDSWLEGQDDANRDEEKV